MAFKMKGHTLPGIKQRMDKSSKPDGRAKSSAFQHDNKKRHNHHGEGRDWGHVHFEKVSHPGTPEAHGVRNQAKKASKRDKEGAPFIGKVLGVAKKVIGGVKKAKGTVDKVKDVTGKIPGFKKHDDSEE